MKYMDIFAAAVPTENKEAYIRHARAATPVFKRCGVLRYVECWGDDVPAGKLTSFPIATQCKENETITFGWMAWKDKETRDRGMEQAMNDEAMTALTQEMLFDGKRMIYGGFQVIADTGDAAVGYETKYVHSFCVAVPSGHKEAYVHRAGQSATIFKKYGALRYVEAWGDDVPEGEITSFSKATQRRENESVVIGWSVFSSKEAHDNIMPEIMKDKDFLNCQDIPFDGQRLIHAGFQVIIDE